MQFGVISTCKFFKDYKLHLPLGLVQIFVFQHIAVEIVLLPILI